MLPILVLYLHIVDSPKESGQSIEVINIDPNLRFNTIPEIITQQILIADEKVGCRVEEKNGRYRVLSLKIPLKLVVIMLI